ncbi:hypothetical protein ABZ858_07260 [Streptomyces sp. NPDC047017]|uniref:hypothetical protein n=1 Tax=Streptomyces sp. NPDC047017 TaxID=3155024 RepID=UPI003401F0B8
MNTRKSSRLLTALALGVAAVVTPLTVAATPAAAAVTGCTKGYNNANTAWGHCSSGSGHWTLTVQCYFWAAHTSDGNGPGTIYSSCPAQSHITNIILSTDQ